MAFLHGKNTRVYVNGWDLTSYFNQSKLSEECGVHKSTVFNSAADTYLPGIFDSKLVLSGLGDFGANAVDQLMQNVIGSSGSLVTVLPAGDSSQNTALMVKGLEIDYNIETVVDDLVKVSLTVQSDTPATHIKIFAPWQTVSGSTGTILATTYVDNGTSSSNGGVGCLHVGSYSGFTSVTPTVQFSNDGTTFAGNLITFTPVTAGRSAQYATCAGTVGRYLRGGALAVGSGSIELFIGFKRN